MSMAPPGAVGFATRRARAVGEPSATPNCLIGGDVFSSLASRLEGSGSRLRADTDAAYSRSSLGVVPIPEVEGRGGKVSAVSDMSRKGRHDLWALTTTKIVFASPSTSFQIQFETALCQSPVRDGGALRRLREAES